MPTTRNAPKTPTSNRPTSLTIELPNSASLPSLILNPIARATARRALDTAFMLPQLGIVKSVKVFRVTNAVSNLPVVALLRPVLGTRVRAVRCDGFDAEWVWHRDTADPDRRQDRAILYLHGGGFVACGLRTHRRLVSRIARAANVPVLSVAYRQVPDAHPTESVEDCVTAYRQLLAQGFAPDRIVVAGDSAGGFLAFATVLAIRDRGLGLPAGVVGISPASDLDPHWVEDNPNAEHDPLFPPRFGKQLFTLIATMKDGRYDPLWSPVHHSFAGMPPALILIGSTESLRSGAEQLAQRCAESNVNCTLQIWDRQIHVFPAAADLIPEGRAAIRDIGAFVRTMTHADAENSTQVR